MTNSPKQNEDTTKLNRRELFGRIGRVVGLGGLAALFARSVLGPGTPDGAVPLCTECPALRGCGKRDGIVTRRAMKIDREPAEAERRQLCTDRVDEDKAVRRNA